MKSFAVPAAVAAVLFGAASEVAAQSPLEEITSLAAQSKCAATNWKNRWGDPNDPKDKDRLAWQKLAKACPALATEYAAVVLRMSGGEKGEFGPIRHKAAELKTDCDAMLSQIQALAQSKPEICAALK
jgi:hypothetical protein